METVSQSSKNNKENNTTPIAAAYLRVSTTRQKEEGHSIDAQLERIKEYVDENKWQLPENLIIDEEKPATKKENYQEEGVSLIESFGDRPRLTELLILAQKKAYQHLIVYSRDRLSRVVEDTIALELFFQRCGVEIHYVRKGEDFDSHKSDIGRLMHILFTSLAEMEGELLSSRVKDGGRACVAKGRWAGGRIPLGYLPVVHTNNSDNKRKWHTTLKKSEFESEIIKEIFELYNRGMGYRKVAEVMNRKYGFIYWSKGKIESIIKNETYTGYLVWDKRGGRRNPGVKSNPIKSIEVNESARIIDDNTWKLATKIRRKNDLNRDSKFFNTPFLLKSKLVCGKCNTVMKTKNYGKNKKSVYRCESYKYKSDEIGSSDLIINSKLIHNVFLNILKSIKSLDDTTINNLWLNYTQELDLQSNLVEAAISNAADKISDLEEYRKNLMETEFQFKEEEIRNAINEHIIKQSKKVMYYKSHLEKLKKISFNKFTNKDEFAIAIQNVFRYVENLEQSNIRLLIDILIDKVIVNKSGDNLDLKIIAFSIDS